MNKVQVPIDKWEECIDVMTRFGQFIKHKQ